MIFETGGGEVTADQSVKVVAPIMGEREACHMEDSPFWYGCCRWNVAHMDYWTQAFLRDRQQQTQGHLS
eukprot:5725634-Karenia_brevis.AAC.1